MKFIHIADVHLGVVPDAGKSWSEKRAADIWTTFTEVFAVAKKIKVDMVLIAGDLFHRQPLIRGGNYGFCKKRGRAVSIGIRAYCRGKAAIV